MANYKIETTYAECRSCQRTQEVILQALTYSDPIPQEEFLETESSSFKSLIRHQNPEDGFRLRPTCGHEIIWSAKTKQTDFIVLQGNLREVFKFFSDFFR